MAGEYTASNHYRYQGYDNSMASIEQMKTNNFPASKTPYEHTTENDRVMLIGRSSSVSRNDANNTWTFSIKVSLWSTTSHIDNLNYPWLSDPNGSGRLSTTVYAFLYTDSARTNCINAANTTFSMGNRNASIWGSGSNPDEQYLVDVDIPNITGKGQTIYTRFVLALYGVQGDSDGSGDGTGIFGSYVSGSTHNQYYVEEGSFDVAEIQLIKPPVVGTITNTNPYKYTGDIGNVITNTAVSASETSISLSWALASGSDAAGGAKYRVNNGEWVGIANDSDGITAFTINNLTPGTAYTIEISAGNEAGWSDGANNKSITVQTLHSKPVIVFSHDHDNDAGLEDLTIHWQSDKALKAVYWKMTTIGSAIEIDVDNARSGSFVVSSIPGIQNGLSPGASYQFTLYGVSSNVYNNRTSNETMLDAITDEIAKLTTEKPRNITFGAPLVIFKENESGNDNAIEMRVEGRNGIVIIKEKFDMNGNVGSFEFTDDELDLMYKQYSNSHTGDQLTKILVHVDVYTKSKYGHDDYVSEHKNAQLTLTGNAKTAHYNINNSPRRAKVWYNDNGKLKRAVVWHNDNGSIKRSI